MSRPSVPANGSSNWGDGLRNAIFAVSDTADVGVSSAASAASAATTATTTATAANSTANTALSTANTAIATANTAKTTADAAAAAAAAGGTSSSRLFGYMWWNTQTNTWWCWNATTNVAQDGGARPAVPIGFCFYDAVLYADATLPTGAQAMQYMANGPGDKIWLHPDSPLWPTT